ncbi:MAG TPA: Uma2 family endonuclease [Gemmataceae bacterium]|nr:Uma2 family endonuclease [Gemmataceae bacterium]
MATSALVTAREFFGWVDRPENAAKRWELVRGVPIELTPWPDSFHSDHMRVVQLMQDYVIRRGVGSVAFLGDGLITARDPDTVRCPAVMVFLGPPTRDDFPPRYTTGVPHLAIDFAPPGESYSRNLRRVTDYVRFGVPLAWLIDPDDRSVIVYQPKQPPHVSDETDELTGNGVLPDFACKVADLFTLPDSQPPAPAQSPNP